MNEKFDLKTKIGMIYCEVLFLAIIVAQTLTDLSVGIWIAIIVAGVASMYAVDRICLKKGCALRNKYKK